MKLPEQGWRSQHISTHKTKPSDDSVSLGSKKGKSMFPSNEMVLPRPGTRVVEGDGYWKHRTGRPLVLE
jgi:hypothetical protein